MLSVAASVSPHPTPPPRIWRRCYVDCGRKCDADVGFGVARMVVAESPFFGLRNPLVLVAESSCFGCGIVFFWLRKRLFFVVAEAPFLGCGSVSDFGCGIAEIWLRKRRNMVSESEFIHHSRVSPETTRQCPAATGNCLSLISKSSCA